MDRPSLEVVALCGGDHNRKVRAVAEVSWPEGPYNKDWACVSHTGWLLAVGRGMSKPVLVRWMS